MKRFSKIFCVALIAIIFLCGLQNKTFAACPTTPYTDITPNNLGGINICIQPYSCPDYSKSIDLIKQIANFYKDPAVYIAHLNDPSQPTVPDSAMSYCMDNSNNVSLSNFVYKTIGIAPNAQYYTTTTFGDSVNTLKTAIPKNATFNTDTNVFDIQKTLTKGAVTDDNGSGNEAPAVGAPLNWDDSECADDRLTFWGTITNPIQALFKLVNIGIIKLTVAIIKMGVNTMGWLMQPNNLWAPGISNNPAVVQAFSASVSVVNIVFSVVLVMMAIGTILNLKSYKINDLITKFIIVALLINFTLIIAGSILDLANYISLYFYNATLKSIQSGTLTDKWTEILTNKVCLSGTASNAGRLFVSIFINLLVFIAIAAAMLSVCGSLLKRGIMLMFLLIISPFAVICYLLPAKGMGQWWEKWKTSFLQQTFYGVYVSVGFYLGTIMLSALSISNQLSDEELSFASGIIKPILAAGYLIFIVLLADEVAGGSAKASITGATKFALGVAGGAALAGAQQLKAAVTTSAPYENAMNTLSSSRLRAVRGLGQAGLAARDNSASYNEEHGKKIDADVTKRSDAVNRARIVTLAGRTDGRSVREIAAAANQLYKTGHMDAATETILHEHAGNLTNPDIERSGWLSRTTRNAYIRDNNPYMLAGDAFYRATGVTENELNASLRLNAQDILDINPTVATIMGLRPGLNQGAIQNALNGYQRNIGGAIRRFGSCSDNLINTFFNPQNPNYSANLNRLVLGEICRNPASINAAMQLMTNNTAIEPGTINIAHDQIQAYLTAAANVGRYTPQQITSINRPGYFNVM